MTKETRNERVATPIETLLPRMRSFDNFSSHRAEDTDAFVINSLPRVRISEESLKISYGRLPFFEIKAKECTIRRGCATRSLLKLRDVSSSRRETNSWKRECTGEQTGDIRAYGKQTRGKEAGRGSVERETENQRANLMCR